MKKILKFMSMTLVSSFLMSVGGNSVFAADHEPNGFNPNSNHSQDNNWQDIGRRLALFQVLSLMQDLSRTFCSQFNEYCLSKGWELSEERTNSEQVDYFVDRLKTISEDYSHRAGELVRSHRILGNRIVLSRVWKNGNVIDIAMYVRRNDTNAYINDCKLFTVFGAISCKCHCGNLIRRLLP